MFSNPSSSPFSANPFGTTPFTFNTGHLAPSAVTPTQSVPTTKSAFVTPNIPYSTSSNHVSQNSNVQDTGASVQNPSYTAESLSAFLSPKSKHSLESQFPFSFSYSKIHKLLLDTTFLAAKCVKSNPELYTTFSFPSYHSSSLENGFFSNSNDGYTFLSKQGIDNTAIDAAITKLSPILSGRSIPSPPTTLLHMPSNQDQNLQKEISEDIRTQRFTQIKSSILSAISEQWKVQKSGLSFGPISAPVIIADHQVDALPPPPIIQLPSTKLLINDSKAKSYAHVIADLNTFRLGPNTTQVPQSLHVKFPGDGFPLCGRLLEILAPFIHDPIYSGISDILRFIAHVADEQSMKGSAASFTEKDFTLLAKSFFEREFISHVDTVISQDLRGAMLGGRPNLLDRIRGYTNIRLSQRYKKSSAVYMSGSFLNLDSIEVFYGGPSTSSTLPLYPFCNNNNVNDGRTDQAPIYPWATLYFLLRSGADSHLLVDWIEMFESYFLRCDKYFKDALVAAFTGSSSNQLLDSIRNEYLRLKSLGDAVDPFRVTIYILLLFSFKRTSFDTMIAPPPTAIVSTFEDWIWYNLTIYKEASLTEFRSAIQQFAPSYFGELKHGEHHSSNYFSALLKVSSEKPTIFIEVVHIAISLLFYSKRFPFLNPKLPSQLIRQYVTLLTSAFGANLVSLEYLVLLPDCFDFFVEWILATNSYKSPLASINEKGLVEPGPIAVRYFSLIDGCEGTSMLVRAAEAIAQNLLARALSKDEEEAALGLFHICQAYDKLFDLLSSRVSDEITTLEKMRTSSTTGSVVVRQAKGTCLFYQECAPDRVAFNSPSCKSAIYKLNLLLDIYNALLMQKKTLFDKSLDVLKVGKVIFLPTDEEEKFYVSELLLSEKDSTTSRHLGLVLELVMNALVELCKRPTSLPSLKKVGRAVMIFAGKFSSKIGPAHFAALTRLDALFK